MDRRTLLSILAAPLAATDALTRFHIACMTLPYSAFPLERALSGIQQTGHKYVAWGVSHRDVTGAMRPVLDVKAVPSDAAKLAAKCREMGLEPVMMFSTVHLEAKDALDLHLRRIDQAAAAGIPFLLTFGKTTPGEYGAFVENLKSMAGPARAARVTVVIKQHGGNTGTGEACARIVSEVSEPSIKICYDAGNVLDYEKKDPLPDIRTCWRDVRALAIKDHRLTPKDEDCGPGFGQIDHYKLLAPLMRTGLTIPLACENLFEPVLPRPANPDEIDRLARRAREYMETVVRGLSALETTA